jgi:anti-sigma factor (TIGR02949 family)
MVDCDHVMRQLWDYLDEELSSERMDAIRAHLAMCKRCFPQYEFERAFLDAVADARREHSNPVRLRDRVVVALRTEGLMGV